MSLDFPLLVWSRNLFFLSRRGERGRVFAVFFAPFPEKGILDYIAHHPIIQVFTVSEQAISPIRLLAILLRGVLSLLSPQ